MQFTITYTGILASNGTQQTIGTATTTRDEVAAHNPGSDPADITRDLMQERVDKLMNEVLRNGNLRIKTQMNGTAHVRTDAFAVIYAEVQWC